MHVAIKISVYNLSDSLSLFSFDHLMIIVFKYNTESCKFESSRWRIVAKNLTPAIKIMTSF